MHKDNINVIWSETRSKLGIEVKLEVRHEAGRLRLVGKGGGYGCNVTHERELAGNFEWQGVIGNCTGNVWLALRCEQWSFQGGLLRCSLTIWGAHGVGPWLPAGGERFQILGRIGATDSREELAAFLETEQGAELIERGLPAPGAAS